MKHSSLASKTICTHAFAKSFALLFTIFFAQASLACPKKLENLHTQYLADIDICSAFDRYHHALKGLEKKALVPAERVGNLMAPRFINLPDWLQRRDATQSSAIKAYGPAPQTWFAWDAAAQIVDQQARQNFLAKDFKAIDVKWLKDLHAFSMQGLLETAGKFRLGSEIGAALFRSRALTPEQIRGIRSIEYSSLKLVNFHATQCFEDRTSEFKKEYLGQSNRKFYLSQWPDTDPNVFFTSESGEQKQCGYILYAPIQDVQPELESWLATLNVDANFFAIRAVSVDPIMVAARAQRWFISIHPFQGGNGRMSRFAMDLVLKSIGLPAPVLKNMDNDLYSSEPEWAKEVGAGVLRAIEYAEACVQEPSAVGCAVIPDIISQNQKTQSPQLGKLP
jgi:hypothetical protein